MAEGGGHKSQNKRRAAAGGEALGWLLLPAHFQAFESQQISVPELAAVRYYPHNSKGLSTRERVPSR